jgi:hypothetical protein
MQAHGREGTALANTSAQAGRNFRHLKSQGDLWETNVVCQRLTLTGNGSSLWRVTLPKSNYDQPILPITPHSPGIHGDSTYTWERMEACLDRKVVETCSLVDGSTSYRYPTHISPWLEKTRWREQLAGQSLSNVAELLHPPEAREAGLLLLLQSFDALIEQARQSVLTEEINVFALHRISSFVKGRPYKRPLHTKILDGTYRKYRSVWHKLLSFVYRLAIIRQQPQLRYVLTQAQLDALSHLSSQREGSPPLSTAMDQQ